MKRSTLFQRSQSNDQPQIDELDAEEYSEFLIDGEVEAEEPDLIKLLEFDDCEQMIEVVYETN